MTEEEMVSHTLNGVQEDDFEGEVMEGKTTYAQVVRGVEKKEKSNGKGNGIYFNIQLTNKLNVGNWWKQK